MARYKKLDRDVLLDAAELVIHERGTHALSIGTVAAAAGVSRGGIQSAFGSKDQLVDALFVRWSEELGGLIKEAQAKAPEGADPMRTFLKASRELHTRHPIRNRAMMALMAQTKERRAWASAWIQTHIDSMDTSTKVGRHRRLMFLAYKSILAVKSIGILEFSDEDWDEIFADMDELLELYSE